MELRNEKDARFIIRHHVTEEKLLHLEKGVRKLGFQSGGKRIMTIFLGLFLLCMAAKVVIGGTIGDALMMIGILCAMGFVFGIYALVKGWLDAKKQIHLQFEAGRMEDEVANMNAAAAALSRNDLISAERYLGMVNSKKHLPEYTNAMGVLMLLKGEYEHAEEYLKAAAKSGLQAAGQNLEELAKKKKNAAEIEKIENRDK